MQLRDYVTSCARRFPDKAAYVHGTTRRSWRAVHERSDRFTAALQALGFSKGDRIGVLSHNRIEIVEHWFACLKGGYHRVGINWRYSVRELLHVARDADVAAILVDAACIAGFESHLEELRHEGRVLIGFGPDHGLEHDYETLLAGAGVASYPEMDGEDLCMVAYTSGTTGMPKGVMLSHRAVLETSIHTVLELGFRYDDVRAYVSNPSGLNIFQVCFNTFTGMTTVLDDFETHRFLDLVREHRITCVTLIPTMIARVVDAVRVGHHDVSSLRQIYYGSMPSTPALIRAGHETLGCSFVQGYGVSESCGPMAGLTTEDHHRALNGEPEILKSVGQAFSYAAMDIRDDEGHSLPAGESGTVWLRCNTLMTGYLNLPAETAECLMPPWYKTGDFGYMDKRGYVFLADRKKHMIISGGMNIYPTSIENILTEHHAVREVVVVGVPHPAWGEAVAAAVTLKPGMRVSVEDLVVHCNGRLPRWEIPKYLEIVGELPKGNTDKLDKRAVAQGLIGSGRLPWKIEN